MTTLTNLLLLTVWFAKRSRFATVVLGRVLGFSGLLFLSLASWGLPPLPDSVVHWLGLVPISMSAASEVRRSEGEDGMNFILHFVFSNALHPPRRTLLQDIASSKFCPPGRNRCKPWVSIMRSVP